MCPNEKPPNDDSPETPPAAPSPPPSPHAESEPAGPNLLPATEKTAKSAFCAHVLLVVSDPIECARLGRAVCHCGHLVSLVCDGNEAAAILRTARFDLVIVEIDPPSQRARLSVERLLSSITCPIAVLSETPGVIQSRSSVGKSPRFELRKPATDDSVRVLLQKVFPI